MCIYIYIYVSFRNYHVAPIIVEIKSILYSILITNDNPKIIISFVRIIQFIVKKSIEIYSYDFIPSSLI